MQFKWQSLHPFSGHCVAESNSAALGETRAPYTFWPAMADSNMIQTCGDNGKHLISSVERKKKLSDIFWGVKHFHGQNTKQSLRMDGQGFSACSSVFAILEYFNKAGKKKLTERDSGLELVVVMWSLGHCQSLSQGSKNRCIKGVLVKKSAMAYRWSATAMLDCGTVMSHVVCC